MEITATSLYKNPHGAEGLNSVNLYNTSYARNLTLAQLISAVCLRTGAVLERHSVRRMNELNRNDDQMSELSDALRKLGMLSTDSALTNQELAEFQNNWAQTRAKLIAEYGLVGLTLDTTTYQGRMESMDLIKKEIETKTKFAQETMIEIQNLINRREVAMSTASNIVRSQGTTMRNTADRMRLR